MPGVVGVVGSIAGGLISSRGASRAANAQDRASEAQIAEARRQFDLTRGDNEPFRQAGVGAITAQQALLGLGADPAAQEAAFARWRNSTGYQFGLNESLRGVQQSAAARGGLYSGAAMKALQDRASQVANQGFGTYFNQIGALAGQGQAANANNQQASQSFMGSFNSATQNAANARASAYQQQAGAWGGVLNQLGGIAGYYGGQGGGSGFMPNGGGAFNSGWRW